MAYDLNPVAPVFADMMHTMAGLAADLVCEHKAVEFTISFGDKSVLLLGARVPVSEEEGAKVVKSITTKATLHGYKIDGAVGPEEMTPLGLARRLSFAMRDIAEEPALH
ncbi:hypothetical protein DWF00_27125 [Bosea caraganae]|uniref:Uncharacterized protein n=1 Tax=Bosea caraganae TaxID=2763117 RepID=A0A370L9U7_9HYPH|nr:hypothetical protein [Bosea caraganae]RDJ21995.1 hypothetical protein DWF00_27125 [Bosea caraganae]RDJ27971.1 hypothetical protein DWE98_05030 [Bosea caraganae]